ncbi:hypothetical protein [Shimia sagamensis]
MKPPSRRYQKGCAAAIQVKARAAQEIAAMWQQA